ncbi:DNA-binding transcriptional regulator, MerR family [Streptomyces sp. OV198]|nr:DNA-binding transcriptional MerR regulator [Streptomyces sp. Ag82_O1-15]SOE79502.1 DNA-binding transcriptional regulator, MerR family [Streptomyces sp. OV198]
MVFKSLGALVPYGTRAPRCVPTTEVRMTAENSLSRLDDDDYPAYTMGRAAEMLGTTPAFLRAIGEARLITPLRSEGGHRRYSRYQLKIAARARELVDQGTPVEAACRIVILEDQLEEARRINEEHRAAVEPRRTADA